MKISDLTASYDGKPVFAGVELAVSPGEILGILGPNGSGKTTLLKALARSILMKEPIGYVPQDFRSTFFSWMSLQSNICFSMRPQPDLGTRRSRIAFIAEQLGLTIDLRLSPRKCSGGMLQQAALIRSFCSGASVILADEPFSSLDVGVHRRLRWNIRSVIRQSQMSLICVLHDLEDLAHFCDDILLIPGRPFSTREDPSLHTARIVRNRSPELTQSATESSFLEISRRFFAGKGA